VVKILLEWEEVNPDKPDSSGQTALMLATWPRHEGGVKILPGCEGGSPDKPNYYSKTPLSLATANCYEKGVALLSSHKSEIPSMI